MTDRPPARARRPRPSTVLDEAGGFYVGFWIVYAVVQCVILRDALGSALLGVVGGSLFSLLPAVGFGLGLWLAGPGPRPARRARLLVPATLGTLVGGIHEVAYALWYEEPLRIHLGGGVRWLPFEAAMAAVAALFGWGLARVRRRA